MPESTPDVALKTTGGVKVRAWKLPEQDGELRVVLHREAREAVDDKIVKTKRTQLEQKLADLQAGFTVPGRCKNYTVVQRKVGRFIEKYKKVAYQYEVKVIKKKDSPNAERLIITKRPAYDACTEAFGGYVLRTSHTQWSTKKIARTYWQLGEIERTFRTMKSDLGLRPMYHRRDTRIEAHLLLSIQAFHTAHLIRSKLRVKNIHNSWGTLKVKLNERHRITTVLPQNDTHCILLKQDADLTPFLREIYHAMGLKISDYTHRQKAKRPKNTTLEV